MSAEEIKALTSRLFEKLNKGEARIELLPFSKFFPSLRLSLFLTYISFGERCVLCFLFVCFCLKPSREREYV